MASELAAAAVIQIRLLDELLLEGLEVGELLGKPELDAFRASLELDLRLEPP